MFRAHRGAPRGLHFGLLGLISGVALVAASIDTSNARGHRHHRSAARSASRHVTESYSPAYSAIVVDGNTGNVLHSASPDALRHPASLTKIMTLYLLFERLDAGKFKLDSPLKVSEHASVQSPTKLGVKPGQTIEVEDAIKAIVTRSANDVAVVVGENIAGDEDDFAELMTQKAHALGMSHTVYRNASGLPDDEQVTSARDQAILGRAIQERFPRYYRYFSTRVFNYHGVSIGNHNHLLGQVDGIDGIKTGYTRASGFNLVTSVHRDGRYLVSVVMGGSSAGSRDARMRELIAQYIPAASARRSAPMVAEVANAEKVAERPVAKPVAAPEPKAAGSQRFTVASAVSIPVPAPLRSGPVAVATIPAAHPAPPAAVPLRRGSADPIRPVMVKTLTFKTAGPAPVPAQAYAAETAKEAAVARSGGAASMLVAHNTATGSVPEAAAAPLAEPLPAATASSPSPAKQIHSGWMIQVGAYPGEQEAKQRLSTVKSKAPRLLASADAFTETVSKGDKTLYRARFAGLDKDQAEAACKYLKRNDVDCMTLRN